MSSTVLERPRSRVDHWEGSARVAKGPAEDVPAEDSVDRSENREKNLARRFAVLAKTLADDASGVSAPRRLMRHPAYLEILVMGNAAVPLLLRRLETPGARPVWLSLLGRIVGAPPGFGAKTIDESSDLWMQWGRRYGNLSSQLRMRHSQL